MYTRGSKEATNKVSEVTSLAYWSVQHFGLLQYFRNPLHEKQKLLFLTTFLDGILGIGLGV